MQKMRDGVLIDLTPEEEAEIAAERAAALAPDVLAADLLKRVADKRLAVMQLGFPYEFSDVPGTVQIRDTTDTGNVNGIVTTALVMKAAGVTAASIPFTDAEDHTHMLTPDEAIAMGMATGIYVTSQYTVKWNKRIEILALAQAGDVQALLSYDIDSGWGP